jgi:CBS domain containing-hemolysin-like protein
MSGWIQALIALLLALLNGFFVAAEFALVKVRTTRVEEMAKAGSRAARMARRELQSLDIYLAASQIGITLASLGLGWVGENLAERLADLFLPGLAIPHVSRHAAAIGLAVVAFLGITFLHVVVGEQAPKLLAIQHADTASLWIAYPLHFFYRLFFLPIALLNRSSKALARLVGLEPERDQERAHSEEELRMILTASQQSGVLKDSELDLVEHVFEFADKRAKDIMVPRVDMVYLSTAWPIARNLEVVDSHSFTRFPLCEGDPDHVIGMIHVKDLLRMGSREDADLRTIAREIVMVPESRSIDSLLREFQYRKMQMAIVLDEYGGTAGLATLEDVLEEIVGEIQDEFEEEVPDVQELGQGRYLVDGSLPLLDLKEDLGIDIPPNGADTLGGFVVEKLGAVPSPGDFVLAAGHRIEISEMENKRVRKLVLTPLPGADVALDGVRRDRDAY